MDFKVCFVLFFSAFFSIHFANGDVATLFSDPAPKGYCHMKKYNILFEIGKSMTKVGGYCNKYECSYPEINYYGCGIALIQTPDGKSCRGAHDLSKDYPDCCVSDKCADD